MVSLISQAASQNQFSHCCHGITKGHRDLDWNCCERGLKSFSRSKLERKDSSLRVRKVSVLVFQMFLCVPVSHSSCLIIAQNCSSTATDCRNSILQPPTEQGPGHSLSRVCRLVKETSISHFIPNFNECLQFISKNLKMH